METTEKKKLCVLTKIAGIDVLVLFVLFVIAILSEIVDLPIPDAVGKVFIVLGGILLFALPFLTIASLIRISLHGEQLRGRLFSIFLLALSLFVVFEGFLYEVPAAKHRLKMPRRVICGINLKGLGTALVVYANDYEGTLPAENWCDRLIEECDVPTQSFQCRQSDSVEGESDYSLNVHAAGKKLGDLPGDMVVLFEANYTPAQEQTRQPIAMRPGFDTLEVLPEIFRKETKVYLDRWNQVGGPERLAYNRHEDGCNILFADGHNEFIVLEKLPTLRWNEENTVFFEVPVSMPRPVPKTSMQWPKPDYLLFGLGGISLAAALVILIKTSVWRHGVFALFLGVLSAGMGWLFGGMSEAAYRYMSDENTNGQMAGLFFGLLTGICFASALAASRNRLAQLKSCVWFVISVGMPIGILCSTLVHLALMIVHRTANPFGIVIGIPFGLFAGAVLGLIAGVCIKKIYLSEGSGNTMPQTNEGQCL